MEEFSFKPLSEGLGFYEKKPAFGSTGKRSLSQSGEHVPLSPEVDLPEEIDLDDSETYKRLLSLLEKPYLGRLENSFNQKEQNSSSCVAVSDTSAASSRLSVPSVFESDNSNSESPFQKKDDTPVDKIKEEPVFVASVKEGKEASVTSCFEKTFYFSLKAYTTDACVAALLFFPPFVFFVFLTQLDPKMILWSVWPKTLFAFLFFVQIYCLLCRLFCFETCGESLSKIRLFTLRSQGEIHPFLLFWRFLLVCLTGIILLPLLSLVFKKDFVARLTGLYFQKT